MSKCHKSAIGWWKSNKLKTMKEIPMPNPEIKFTNFVKSSPSARSSCLCLWDVEIASNFENDKYIRRYQPKTLFKKKNCGSYVKTQKIMQIVKITRNGNTCTIENSKNFVKKGMRPVNHSMCHEKPMLLLMVNLC